MHENWERRLSILRELARRQAGGELPPNLRELGAAVGLRSSRSIHGHLSNLRQQGYIESDGRARSYRLTSKGWETVGEMPMLGDIAAGQGLEVVGRDEIYSLVTELASSRSGARRFVLRTKGDSMIGAGIADGDALVVEYDESPPDGTIVVALDSRRKGDHQAALPGGRDGAPGGSEPGLRGHHGSGGGRDRAGARSQGDTHSKVSFFV